MKKIFGWLSNFFTPTPNVAFVGISFYTSPFPFFFQSSLFTGTYHKKANSILRLMPANCCPPVNQFPPEPSAPIPIPNEEEETESD